jgi:hypothetical protein
MASQQPVYAEVLRCRVCKNHLTARDKQKTTNNYWKNCKSCRDKQNEVSRRRKGRRFMPALSKANSDAKRKKLNSHDAERNTRKPSPLSNPTIARSKLGSTVVTSPESLAQKSAHFRTSDTSHTSFSVRAGPCSEGLFSNEGRK